MNGGEANDTNTVLQYVVFEMNGRWDATVPRPVVEAAARLANRARAQLGAGLSGDAVLSQAETV